LNKLISLILVVFNSFLEVINLLFSLSGVHGILKLEFAIAVIEASSIKAKNIPIVNSFSFRRFPTLNGACLVAFLVDLNILHQITVGLVDRGNSLTVIKNDLTDGIFVGVTESFANTISIFFSLPGGAHAHLFKFSHDRTDHLLSFAILDSHVVCGTGYSDQSDRSE
jgi:hypothetical protein